MSQHEPARKIFRSTPPKSLDKHLASQREVDQWTPRQHAQRTCVHCHRRYHEGGAAWRCEHWHEQRPE